MGLDEVERISSRMKEILTMLGYDKNKSVGELMNQLNESSEFLYADTPDRKDIVVNDYAEMTKTDGADDIETRFETKEQEDIFKNSFFMRAGLTFSVDNGDLKVELN